MVPPIRRPTATRSERPAMSFLESMSFREKTAWVMTIILVLAGLHYAREILEAAQALGHTPPPMLRTTIGYVILIVVASVISMSVLGAMTPREAEAPADERERIVRHKAGDWSGIVLGFGVISGMFHYIANRDGDLFFHIAVASLMISLIVEYVFQIILLRRGV